MSTGRSTLNERFKSARKLDGTMYNSVLISGERLILTGLRKTAAERGESTHSEVNCKDL